MNGIPSGFASQPIGRSKGEFVVSHNTLGGAHPLAPPPQFSSLTPSSAQSVKTNAKVAELNAPPGSVLQGLGSGIGKFYPNMSAHHLEKAFAQEPLSAFLVGKSGERGVCLVAGVELVCAARSVALAVSTATTAQALGALGVNFAFAFDQKHLESIISRSTDLGKGSSLLLSIPSEVFMKVALDHNVELKEGAPGEAQVKESNALLAKAAAAMAALPLLLMPIAIPPP